MPITLSGLHVDIPVTLDGKKTLAMLDTGTTSSIMGKEDASHIFGVTVDDLKPDGQIMAASGTVEKFYTHKFGKLEIGDLKFNNPEINIVDNQGGKNNSRWFSDSVGIILGIHHLRMLRIYIDYADQMLYVSATDAH